MSCAPKPSNFSQQTLRTGLRMDLREVARGMYQSAAGGLPGRALEQNPIQCSTTCICTRMSQVFLAPLDMNASSATLRLEGCRVIQEVQKPLRLVPAARMSRHPEQRILGRAKHVGNSPATWAEPKAEQARARLQMHLDCQT
mmetsp:Transcript_38346/g.91611  ORF Transcript_38346/g.91611 Transcript_38346/m.91611 type:complete len:142 (-) Transcript_38346:128-553(-)